MDPDNDLTVDSLPFNSDQTRFFMEIYLKMNEIISTLNNKDSSIYSNESFYMSGKWYIDADPENPKQMIRKVISFGALPNTALKSVAHEINGANPIDATWIVIPVCGRSFNPTLGVTIPIYNPDTYMVIDYTNVNITTTADLSQFTTTEIILLYIQP